MIKNIEKTKDGMSSLIDGTRDAVVGVAARAERGVESAAQRAVEGAHVAGEFVRGRAETASRGAHRGLDGAADAVDRGYSRAQSDLTRAAAGATDYVTQNPGRSLLLAASTGFVLGTFVRWRRGSA